MAFDNQPRIGWNHLFKGKLASNWLDHIQQHLNINEIQSTKMTTKRWATGIILELWSGVLRIWDHRNKEIHGINEPERT